MRAATAVALLALFTLPVTAQTLPEWAYPVNPSPKPPDNTIPKHLPGSSKTYTQAQIDDSTCDAATILPPYLEKPTIALRSGQASSS